MELTVPITFAPRFGMYIVYQLGLSFVRIWNHAANHSEMCCFPCLVSQWHDSVVLLSVSNPSRRAEAYYGCWEMLNRATKLCDSMSERCEL